jgi:Flp pilus assembly protein TadD
MSSEKRRQMLEQMLADAPNDPELRYALAMEHASTGDDEGAARCFRDLLQRTPDYAPAYHQAGRSLHRLGRLAEARDALQRGIPVALRQNNKHAADEMQALLDNLD